MDKRRLFIAAASLAAGSAATVCTAQSPFATRVIAYSPAPGQNVANPAFNDPARALGAPIGGGTSAADNTKAVTLGGFGGSLTLGFDHPIADQPPTATNPSGADMIVFGNAFWAAGNPDARWAEPGVIEVSRDDNGNGLADDAWYVIHGSHLPAAPQDAYATVSFAGGEQRTGYRLDAAVFTTPSPLLQNPLAGTGQQGINGYADCTPTLVPGDFDGDGLADTTDPDPAWFYTVPTDPSRTGVTAFSGGGDAIDIGSAVAPDGSPAGLDRIDFVRIRTGVSVVRGVFGETSTEVCGVAEVRSRKRADIGRQGGVLGPDGLLDNNDFIVFIDLFFSLSTLADCGQQGGVGGADGQWDNNDFIVFIDGYFSGQ